MVAPAKHLICLWDSERHDDPLRWRINVSLFDGESNKTVVFQRPQTRKGENDAHYKEHENSGDHRSI